MYICSITWPKNNDEIMKLLLSFMIQVVDKLKICFPEEMNNPLDIAKSFMKGDISLSEYEKAYECCWKYIDDRDAIREFGKTDILLARLGICLLSANNNLEEAGEKLAWFFEVLDYLKINTDDAEKLMVEHFSFSD